MRRPRPAPFARTALAVLLVVLFALLGAVFARQVWGGADAAGPSTDSVAGHLAGDPVVVASTPHVPGSGMIGTRPSWAQTTTARNV